ncbi:hypothetical protein MCOR27_010004 [Pyricularia oryzae]|nr:hypothetical protein MCOR01_010020 [Pyricularia oryzae]KAI6292714.1 hypothetical protein MCOR33_009661 [Pyricularia grisea]KAH9436663.1 hypothetical protein MCOR02_000333 [Pyricularia oryzae]KAI6252178.1 hypothetical protein MCOR19_011202 [Pyricularia oryzae]KAI6268797.1 hypothetical protein MCOR27_010004 [Pyricularia oryzae]
MGIDSSRDDRNDPTTKGPSPACHATSQKLTERKYGSQSVGKSEDETRNMLAVIEADNGRPSDEASFAFAFDIDGVLLHQSEPLPGATDALRFLQANKIPFILLTNGGGKHEHERVAELSAKLGVPLTTGNFVQSHTPFSGLNRFMDKNILVTGSDAAKSREIAEAYGFTKVITPADILMANPTIWPFDPLLESVYASTARPLPQPIYNKNPYMKEWPKRLSRDNLQIHAVFIFNDPRDWALDIQIITDLLLSHSGVLGTYSAANSVNGKWPEDKNPWLFYSNSDLLWASKHPLPRMGQGAFQAALAGVWADISDTLGVRGSGVRSGPRCTRFGKPIVQTYQFAERVLMEHRRQLLGEEVANHRHLRNVYMVGDNPASDIAGANAFKGKSRIGTDWWGVLVKTGVFNPDISMPLQHKPKMIVDDVFEAVKWALGREQWRGPPLVMATREAAVGESHEGLVENMAKGDLLQGDGNVVEGKIIKDGEEVVVEGETIKEGK